MALTGNEIRQKFMQFFADKGHRIVSSAPMVVKDDPTLMFTNAGMNQFKDIFLGNRDITDKRVVNTQKCLRVSGKHNDLEEVGRDTYHHTMFEMLGNWSFGDYFKEEAIKWAWELLVDEFKIDPSLLYATVFEGDASESLEPDNESRMIWQKYLGEDRVLNGSKKDNFWEMGETGPCGPCSEVHIDLRTAEERAKTPGRDLVNTGDPLVIELWNLVFIQFNRLVDGGLVPLPNKHVDTGMGFERLCRVLQNVDSNYGTDTFRIIIKKTEDLSGKRYGENDDVDIAFRVIADHLRAIAFSIADGQLPSNVKAGYVIRRILRRAVRFGYRFLAFREPFINRLVPTLTELMGDTFPEIKAQESLIMKVIAQEESAFLKTLEVGTRYLDEIIDELETMGKKVLDGKRAFVLYDTFGFPIDLTSLILGEHNLTLDIKEFEAELEVQKNRSREDAKVESDDWVELVKNETENSEFVGYDNTIADIQIVKYRKVTAKGKTFYHLVFDKTPFYAEAGGQIGDTGAITNIESQEVIKIVNTKFENQLAVHITETLPSNPHALFNAVVNFENRKATERNHSATHLLHHALRKVLGDHVEQKGSLVHYDYFRFDFSHYGKMTPIEIAEVEMLVNKTIMASVNRSELRDIPLEEAKQQGATSLFGEKYGDFVRVIRFGDSVELCGGTHVANTGEIGVFKILSEGAIAAGIRRIEACTGVKALEWINSQITGFNDARELLKNPKDLAASIRQLMDKIENIEQQLDALSYNQAFEKVNNAIDKSELVNGIRFVEVGKEVPFGEIKNVAFELKKTEQNLIVLYADGGQGKASVAIFVSSDISAQFSALGLIKEVAPLIKGGGGGQDFFASAGGKNCDGVARVKEIVRKKIMEIKK